MADTGQGELLHGMLFEPRTTSSVPFTQRIHNHPQGESSSPVENLQVATEAIPVDANATAVKVFDLDAFAELNKDYYVKTCGHRNLNQSLPLVLSSVDITWNKQSLSGLSSSTTVQSIYVNGGTAAQRPRTSAQGSGSVMPSIIPTILEPNANDVPVELYSFYVGERHTRTELRVKVTQFAVTGFTATVNTTSNVVTATDSAYSNGYEVVLTTTDTLPAPLAKDTIYYVVNVSGATFKLATTVGGSAIDLTTTGVGIHTIRRVVLDWPHFKAQAHEIQLFGMEATLQQSADTTSSITEPSSGPGYQITREKSTAKSSSISLTTRRERIPPTIHGAINFNGSSTDSVTITATASADTITVTGTNASASAVTNSPTPASMDVVGSVAPASLLATSPAAIPTSELYFYDSDLGTTEYGQAFVTVTLVDMSYFA